ncbi:hypothetical protein AYI69_g11208 [Smittium culicis]|uniref:Uncharacterized protein n=1 Tax=Smittium culicis TaxID=133412 RepID=A0A1R1X0C6_9FUNG|nr:hypothetical protein AYI69_g11208 [Smittium culicis]
MNSANNTIVKRNKKFGATNKIINISHKYKQFQKANKIPDSKKIDDIKERRFVKVNKLIICESNNYCYELNHYSQRHIDTYSTPINSILKSSNIRLIRNFDFPPKNSKNNTKIQNHL